LNLLLKKYSRLSYKHFFTLVNTFENKENNYKIIYNIIS